MPTYSIFGWQKPCYLLQDGYADTFQELMDAVEWPNYGTESGNPRCANCMVHSGYEASRRQLHLRLPQGTAADRQGDASQATTTKAPRSMLNEWKPERHGPLVQIAAPVAAKTSELQSVSGD